MTDVHGWDVMVLVRTVWGEARGEPLRGQLAVAYVVLNRWRSGKWFAGKTLASTCLKAHQFSAWNTGDLNREAMCDATDADLADCRAAARAAVEGSQSDPTDGCTHYHTVAVSPAWARGREPYITIGRHAFYKDVP